MIWALLSLARAEPLVTWELQDDDGGLSPGSGDLHWSWGEPSVGPGSGHEGSACWGTNLDGLYLNDAEGSLQLPGVDLSGALAPVLSYWQWTDIQPGDAGWIEIEGPGGWQRAEPIYGYPDTEGFVGDSSGWEQVFLDLSGLDSSSSVRLTFSSDASVSGVGWYVDDLAIHDEDVVPPRVEALLVPPDTEDLIGPYPVEVSAEDDRALGRVELIWSADGGEPQASPMADLGGLFEGTIPGQSAGTSVTWWVEAEDGVNLSTTEPASFEVRLLPPTDLSGPEGRVVAVEVDLGWSEPDSMHPIEGYVVYRGGEELLRSTQPSATVPVEGGGESFAVSTLYDVGESEPCEALEVDVSRPRLLSVEPDRAWQGDTLHLELTGEHLLLVQGEVELDLGAGVEILETEVVDVDRALVQLHVSDDAALGERSIFLRTGDVELDDGAVFEVLDGGGRPRLEALSPDRLRQGETGTLVLTTSTDLEGEQLSVDLGEGVVVESVSSTGPRVVEIQVVVDPLAPLGEREVVLDDGVRLYEGQAFRVRDALVKQSTCSHASLGPWVLGLLMLLLRRLRAA